MDVKSDVDSSDEVDIALTQLSLFSPQKAKLPSVKAEQRSLEFPMFSLSKIPEGKIEFRQRGVVVVARNNQEVGVCTIYDADLLKFIWSLGIKYVREGRPFPKKIGFKASDYFRFKGLKKVGGRNYENLKQTITRLRSTDYETTVGFEKGEAVVGVKWFDASYFERDLNGKITQIKVILSDWFIRMAASEKSFLTLPHEYFRVTSGLERRIFEIVWKHCGRQSSFEIGMDVLQAKCGSNDPYRKFVFKLRKIVQKNKDGKFLNDYQLCLEGDRLKVGYIGKRSLPEQDA